MGGGLTVALKHLGYAPQRYDSSAVSSRKLCCLIVPCALLLAAKASDKRESSEAKQRAFNILRQLPKFVCSIGLAADYESEVNRYVRLNDVAHHDIAAVAREKRAFIERLETLFVHGAVLADPVTSGHEGETATQIVMQQAEAAGTIFCGEKPIRLWSRDTKDMMLKQLASLADVVKATKDRLHAEIYDGSVALQFEAFDLQTWRRWLAREGGGGGGGGVLLQANREEARHQFRTVAYEWGVRDADEMWQLSHDLVRVAEALARGGGELDDSNNKKNNNNIEIWRLALANGMICSAAAPVVAWYCAISDGTSQVERDLGSLASGLEVHVGPLEDETLAAIVEVRLDGPAVEEEVAGHASEEEGGALELTSFSRRCCQLWIEKHGRRFSCYKVRSDKGQHRDAGPRAGSDRSVVAKQTTALSALASISGERLSKMASLFHCPLEDLARRTATIRERRRSAGLAACDAATNRRMLQQQAHANGMHRETKKAVVIFTKPLGDTAAAVPPHLQAAAAAGRAVAVADLTTTSAEPCPPKGAGYRLRRPPNLGCVAAVAFDSELLVVQSQSQIENGSTNAMNAEVFLIAVALGKSIMSRSVWLHDERPEASHLTRHCIAALVKEARFSMSRQFEAAHISISRTLRRLADRPESKWTISEEPAYGENAFHIVGVSDVFLASRALQRVWRHAGVGGRFTSGER